MVSTFRIEGGKLKLSGTAEYQLDANLIWSKIKEHPGWENEIVADMRDESAEDIRLVIEPRSRTVDAELLMESLFKLTELESRIPLNMNVLVKGRVPKVLGLDYLGLTTADLDTEFSVGSRAITGRA